MFRLNELSPTVITYQDRDFKIDMAFDTILDVMDVLNEANEKNLTAKCYECLLLLCSDQDFLDNLDEEQIFEFFGLIRSELIEFSLKKEQSVTVDRKGNPLPTPKVKNTKGDGVAYSLVYDASYVYTSFLQAYNIDLRNELGKLHWHEFSAMLRDLPDTTAFGRILEIRGTDLSTIKDKKEKERMRKLKDEFSLPTN